MQEKKVSQQLLITGIVTSMFLWGVSWPSGKVLAGYCTVINFSVYRYIVVVLTMPFLLLLLGNSFRVKKEGIPTILISGFMLALYSYVFFRGLEKGSPGAGGVLVTTMNPIMAYAINITLKRTLPSRNEAIGLTLGIIAGCILLRLWDNTSALFDSGNIFFLLSALTWAAMSKFTAKGAKYSSSLGFSMWQYVVTLACLLPLANYTEMQAALHVTEAKFWVNLIFSGAIVTAGATSMFFYTTTRLGAERASSFIFLVPFAAAASSWLLLGEQIKVHTAVGGILGMVAVYIMNKKKQPV